LNFCFNNENQIVLVAVENSPDLTLNLKVGKTFKHVGCQSFCLQDSQRLLLLLARITPAHSEAIGALLAGEQTMSDNWG
jgi:hypothetical protein